MFCNFLNFAQINNSAVAETIFISTNATTFVSGENLLYKINCLNTSNKKTSDLSKVAYIKLLSSKKEEIFTNTLFLKNGVFYSDFFIDSKLPTGIYKLIAYTNWMMNNKINKFSELEIYVINPFQPLDIVKNNPEIIETSKKVSLISTLNQNYKFALNKKQFGNREKVDLSLVSKNLQKGNYTLSIRKKEELPLIQTSTSSEFLNNIVPEQINYLENNIELPELRGELISGKIGNKTNPTEIANKTVTLSISGKDLQVKVVKTNKIGKFIFNIDKHHSSSNLVIQVLESNKEDFTITLDSKKNPDLTNIVYLNPPILSENYTKKLEEHSIANQIENAYYSKKMDSLMKNSNNYNFYEPWQKTYILDDYTRFPTLAETITEIIFEMYYTKNKDNYTIGLRDFNVLTQVPEPALVMVDGLIIQDLKELFEYKMSNVYKISTIQGGYFLGSNVFNGIINISTKKFDFTSNLAGSFLMNLNLQPTTFTKKYYEPNYLDKSKSNRIPDYRYQLLWEPNFDIENPISFYTSDIKGVFEIILDGYTDDGIPVHSIEGFEVK